VYVARRTMARPGLLGVRFIGALVAVILVAGVSLYSAAMGDAMLQSSLRTDTSSTYFAVSLTNVALTATQYSALDGYIRRQESGDLGLPLHIERVHHGTAAVSLYRIQGKPGGHVALAASLSSAALDYDEGVADHAGLVAGTLDPPPAGATGSAGVMVASATAQRLHLSVGDRLAFSANGITPIQPILVIAGIFTATDPTNSYWSVASQDSVPNILITSDLATFQTFAAHADLFEPSYFWLQQTDLQAIHLSDADALLTNLTRVNSRVAAIAPGAGLLESLSLDINDFQYQYDLLPSILLILVTPIALLILYAVVVTTGLVLERQAGEILLIRSRGATRNQVFAIYMIEGLIFAGAALLVGPPLGLGLAVLIDHASGFLTFGGGLPINLRLTGQAYLLAAATALACVLVGLLPALGLARRSLLEYTVERGRLGRPLFRFGILLDLGLLAVALYGLVVLRNQGPVTSGAATAAVAQDPLVAVAPLLFSIAVTLLIGRVLPRLAGAGLRFLARVSSPAAVVALRSIARAPRRPIRLVQLCTLTLTFGIFAATVAGIETRNAADQQAYDAGATVRVGAFPDKAHPVGRTVPIADYRALPGVHAVMPALRFESTGDLTNSTSDGTNVDVLGIDPAAAPPVIWFRPDFADLPLRRLLAPIAGSGPNAIVSDTFLQATGLHLGDSLQVILTTGWRINIRIAGTAHYFPTLDPRAYPFVVTNLAYLEQVSHAGAPNEMWLAADPRPAAVARLITAARGVQGAILVDEGIAPADDVGTDPLKVGIYGVVSVGFLIAVALALLGLIAYAYLAMQQRLTEFAVVRALGLSEGGMRALLLYEQVFLLGAAITGGIAAGLLTTQLYLPYLPIATRSLPPFLVVTPWGSVVLFVLALFVLFLLVLSVHLLLVIRLPLGRVLRLGDA
jgi:putative ABC transport system permease protein